MRVLNGWMTLLIGVTLFAAGCASGGTTDGGGVPADGGGATKMNEETTDATAAETYDEVEGAKARDGFAVYEIDGKTWVYRRDSKEHAAFLASGPSDKHSTKLMSGLTVKGPDMDTISAYLASKPGFEVDVADGRIWVYRAGSDAWADHQKNGPSDKHVTMFDAGRTLKGPDMATLKSYAAAKPGFAVDFVDGRYWVYEAGSDAWKEHVAKGPSDKHVTLFDQGRTLKGPDLDTLRAYAAAR